MRKRHCAVAILSILLLSVVLNFSPSSVESSPSYYYNFNIDIQPESPTVEDEVNVTVSFDTASISYIVSFGLIKQTGNDFHVDIDIHVPEIVIWVIGYAENTYHLGKLRPGSYSFNVRIRVWDLKTGMLLHYDQRSRAFDVATEGFLRLETDKSVYAWREEVNISLTNIGDTYVSIAGWPSCLISADPAHEPVWPKYFAFLAWGLAPGESETWTWNQYDAYKECPAAWGKYVVEFFGSTNASFVNKVYFKILPCGDIDGDGDVDFKDIVTIAMAYGSKPGDSNWNPNADLDGDGDVDFDDLVTAATNYGKTSP